MDTPGIHKPMHKMNEVMVKTALQTYKVEHLDGTASVHALPLVAADS